MATIANSVWFKDEKNNTYQLGNGTKIVGCTMAWAKDNNGKIYELSSLEPSYVELVDSSDGGNVSFRKIDSNHYDIHLDSNYYSRLENTHFFKIALKNQLNNIVQIKNGTISNTGDISVDPLSGKGTTQNTDGGYFYFTVSTEKKDTHYYSTHITVTI